MGKNVIINDSNIIKATNEKETSIGDDSFIGSNCYIINSKIG